MQSGQVWRHFRTFILKTGVKKCKLFDLLGGWQGQCVEQTIFIIIFVELNRATSHKSKLQNNNSFDRLDACSGRRKGINDKDYDYFTKHDDGHDAHGKCGDGISSYVASDDRPSRSKFRPGFTSGSSGCGEKKQQQQPRCDGRCRCGSRPRVGQHRAPSVGSTAKIGRWTHVRQCRPQRGAQHAGKRCAP